MSTTAWAKAQYHRVHRRKVKQCLRTPSTKPMKKGYRLSLQVGWIKDWKESHHTKPRKPAQRTPGVAAISMKMRQQMLFDIDMDY